jgi:quinol monooxygenase YgiN
MIDVIASIRIRSGRREDFLREFNALTPDVLAEDGCIAYAATVDVDSGLENQVRDEDIVTIVEKWASLAHLRAHLKAPHMSAYRERVKDIVEGVTLKVLQPA